MNETEIMTEEKLVLREEYAMEYFDLAELVREFRKMVNLTHVQEIVFHEILRKEREVGALKERLEAQGLNEDAALNLAMENGLL